MAYTCVISECLRRQKDNKLFETLPSATLLKNPTEKIPSILSNIKCIGKFPTEDWKEIPLSKGHFWEDSFDRPFPSYYHVFDFDVTDAEGTIMKLNAVIHEGDGDRALG